MNPSLWRASAVDVVERLRSGVVTPGEALDVIEARVAETDELVHALPTLCFDRAREYAEQLERLPVSERGALAGLPVTIKDLMPVEGVRTTFGSAVYADHIADHSDRLVLQIEHHGGIVYAKSNTPEFGTGGISFNSLFPPTRSPRNLRYASGGSSGGAAASLAAGSAWLSLGSDMAGSLRTPAAFCGVTSLRPSPGRILADSECSPFEILAQNGPMARSIADLGLFADVLMHEAPASMREASISPSRPTRVAISSDLGIATVDGSAADLIDEIEASLLETNVEVVRTHPDLNEVHTAFDILRAHDYATGLEQTLADHPDVLKPEVEWNIRKGLELTSAEIREAARMQGHIINRASRFMKDFDLLICPATSVDSVDAGLRYPGSDSGVDYPEYYRWLEIAYATTVTALPIITLPWKLLHNGMPGAIQLIGKPGGEYALFRHAAALEGMSGWDTTPIDPTHHDALI